MSGKKNNPYARIIARAWRDPAFKAKLLKDPAAALAEAGFKVAPGVTVTVSENSASRLHLVLPEHPGEELGPDELEEIAAGAVPTLLNGQVTD